MIVSLKFSTISTAPILKIDSMLYLCHDHNIWLDLHHFILYGILAKTVCHEAKSWFYSEASYK